MNILTATASFLDDITAALKEEGWKDGDSVDQGKYNATDKYFFLDLIKTAYVETYGKIRQLYAVYSMGNGNIDKYADNTPVKANVYGYLYLYLPDPLTKAKLLQFEGIEEKMQEKGWSMSVQSTSSYDNSLLLRQVSLMFQKEYVAEDDNYSF